MLLFWGRVRVWPRGTGGTGGLTRGTEESVPHVQLATSFAGTNIERRSYLGRHDRPTCQDDHHFNAGSDKAYTSALS